MAIATFAPKPRPSPGSRVTNNVSLIEHRLGNGYALNAPTGLNHIAKQVALRWDALTLAQAGQIEGFLNDQGGYKPFWFTLNGETEPRKWTCKDWAVSDDTPATLTATLVECFSNVT